MCASSDFDSTATCRDVVIMEQQNDGGSENTWKWILIGVLLGVAAILGGFMLYKYCSAARVSPELTDADIERPFEHEVDAAKRREANAKGRSTDKAGDKGHAKKKKGVSHDATTPVDTTVEIPQITSRFEEGATTAAGNETTPHPNFVSTPSKDSAKGSRPASPYSLFEAQKVESV